MSKYLGIGLALGFLAFSPATASAAGKTCTFATPTLTVTPTQSSLQVQVCAGATGAPAGFSLQWLTAAEYEAAGNQWPSVYICEEASCNYCKASFSGNANNSNYNLTALAPGNCVTVNVGDFLFDNGASTECTDALTCGTSYLFRVFAHATSTCMKSAQSAPQTFSTLSCDLTEGCTLTQGYWKTHGPIPTGNNVNEWGVTELTLGNVLYTDLQLQSIFDTAASGNGLVSLAHQLIAAKLNIIAGADGTTVAAAIASADALIGNLVAPPVGIGSLAPSATSALTATLASFNEGAIGPGHCQ
jgi:hypothetical protein